MCVAAFGADVERVFSAIILLIIDNEGVAEFQLLR
jgi:hypothetical protein